MLSYPLFGDVTKALLRPAARSWARNLGQIGRGTRGDTTWFDQTPDTRHWTSKSEVLALQSVSLNVFDV